jgi:ubiquinone/menaquinone biosynthesis C-methylase UbiE
LKLSNKTIERLYNFFSGIPFLWEIDSIVCRVTEKSPYRSQIIDTLNLSKGAKVLDMACGTGLNFRLLEKKVGPSGLITGVDNSQITLARAKKRKRKRNYENINIIKCSAENFRSPVTYDAAICTCAIEIIPPYIETLRIMINSVKVGGRIGILGFKYSDRPIMKYFNKISEVMGLVIGGIDLKRDVVAFLRNTIKEVYYKDAFGGFYYIAVFEKTGGQQSL